MNVCKRAKAATFSCAVVIGIATAASAQVRVVGTGDPHVDVPAVQNAVDVGGLVILKGHFSFAGTPTINPDVPGFPAATVRVSKAVTISGVDDHDEMTTIEGGQVPFEVDAPGSAVTIQRLRFVRPTSTAIEVSGVAGLVIASCRIDGVQPLDDLSAGIAINLFSFPTPDQPGHPERISGTLLVVDNDVDVAGATVTDDANGIALFNAGVPGAEAEAYLSGNRIRNTTEPGINVRRVVGRVYVERNHIRTAAFAGPAPRPEALRLVNLGSYVVAQNSIDCRWPQAMGIGVFSQVAPWPIQDAIITENTVTMAPPEGTVFGEDSAGIAVRGFARGSVVLNNSIRGRAAKALSVSAFRGGAPSNTAFVLNRLDDFEASVADVVVGDGVSNTRIVGPGSVENHGTGTVIVRLPSREE